MPASTRKCLPQHASVDIVITNPTLIGIVFSISFKHVAIKETHDLKTKLPLSKLCSSRSWWSGFHNARNKNFILLWNSTYQIIKSPFSKCIVCVWGGGGGGLISPFNKMTAISFYRMSFKNCHRTLLSLWSVQVCAVLPGCRWPLLHLVLNNKKLLTHALLLNDACRLDQCDVIASLVSRAQRSWHPIPNVIYSNSLGPKTDHVEHMVWKHRYHTQLVS